MTAITAKEVRDLVVSVLAGDVGTYEHLDAANTVLSSTEAVRVESGDRVADTVASPAANTGATVDADTLTELASLFQGEPEGRTRVKGLEVVISEIQGVPPIVTTGASYFNQQFEIALKQWDQEKGVTVFAEKLALQLPRYFVRFDPIARRNTQLDTIESQTVVLQFQRRERYVNA